MRATLTIDDDILAAARERAEFEQKTVGAVVSALLRRAMQPAVQAETIRNGVPQLPVQPGSIPLTLEFANRLRDGLL